MEDKDSVATTIRKSFGKTLLDNMFTIGFIVLGSGTGITAWFSEPGHAKTLLIFTTVLFGVGSFVAIYVNHKFTELLNKTNKLITTQERRIDILVEGDQY